MNEIIPAEFFQLWLQGLVLLLGAGYVGLIVWGFLDARKRGHSGIIIAIHMAVLGPLGLPWWLHRRPSDEQ